MKSNDKIQIVKLRNTHTLQSNQSAIMSMGRALPDIQKTAARETMGNPSPRTKQKDNLISNFHGSEALVCHVALSYSQLGALLTIGAALLKVRSR